MKDDIMESKDLPCEGVEGLRREDDLDMGAGFVFSPTEISIIKKIIPRLQKIAMQEFYFPALGQMDEDDKRRIDASRKMMIAMIDIYLRNQVIATINTSDAWRKLLSCEAYSELDKLLDVLNV